MVGQNSLSQESDVISGEPCPVCGEKTLSLTEREDDIPYFGKVALF